MSEQDVESGQHRTRPHVRHEQIVARLATGAHQIDMPVS
jgi:hypothetical protein